MVLVAVLLKEGGCLRDRHPASMHSDCNQIAACTQECHLQLCKSKFGIPVMKSRVEHHLLAVERPSFGIRARVVDLTYQIRIPAIDQKLYIMTGIYLVY